jgi:hypothetical protein
MCSRTISTCRHHRPAPELTIYKITLTKMEMRSDNHGMGTEHTPYAPVHCPTCAGELVITRLQCPTCGTEVAGTFTLGRLAGLREPHASLLELFLRVRGNVKEMERELGLSYPTVRARLEEALAAAGLDRAPQPAVDETHLAAQRGAVLDALERGEIAAAEAATRLRALKRGRSQ